MLGKMLWFNRKRDAGFILTDEDDRLPVLGSSFVDGIKPRGRCAKARVEFDVREDAGKRRAENVSFVEETSPRRARRHSRLVRGVG